MSNPHRTPTPPSTKRLLHELQIYSAEPNDALLHLGPISDEQVLHWEAVLKGVKGSGYEGTTTTISYSFLFYGGSVWTRWHGVRGAAIGI